MEAGSLSSLPKKKAVHCRLIMEQNVRMVGGLKVCKQTLDSVGLREPICMCSLGRRTERWLRSTAVVKVIVYQSSIPMSLAFLQTVGRKQGLKNQSSEQVQLCSCLS